MSEQAYVCRGLPVTSPPQNAFSGQAGGFRHVTRGAIDGDRGGNAVTGSDAAPSGR